MSGIRDMVNKQRTKEQEPSAPSVRGTFKEPERKAVLIRIPVNVHHGLKIKAAQEGTTINELALSALLAQYPDVDM